MNTDTVKPIDLSEFQCRKCSGQKLGRNGAQRRNGQRFQRLICQACKYIWVEYSLLLPDKEPDKKPDKEEVVLNLPKSQPSDLGVAARAQNLARTNLGFAGPLEVRSSRFEAPGGHSKEMSNELQGEQIVNPTQPETPNPSTISTGSEASPRSVASTQSVASTGLATSIQANPATANPSPSTIASLPFRRLELEAPTDWSPSGVLAYTQHAQQALQLALTQFEHPAMAELEVQRLEPRVRAYVRARQAFDTALMLQWAAVFGGPTSSLNTVYGSQLEQPQIRPREAASGARDSVASSSSARDLLNDDPDDPAHSSQVELLRQLEAFKRQERAWHTDRLRLKQELILLELDKQRVVTNWTRVKQHYDGLKSRLRIGEDSGHGISAAALPAAAESTRQALIQESAQESVPESARAQARDFPKTVTSSFRIAPPALSPSEQARIERLSNSLIANLARLEDHQLRPQDIAHVTGEAGPWKTVVEHLLNSGKIERVGEVITFSLVERLRRHLPAVRLEGSTGRRKP